MRTEYGIFQVAGPWTAGVDEVGRGPLAGPVVAAAVILDPAHPIPGLNDSKKLGIRQRAALAHMIRARARAWAIACASAWEIDRDNILQASLTAMARAVRALPLAPRHVYVDGKCRPQISCVCEAVVGGDGKIDAIAAASILAKVFRDAQMTALATHYAGYGFEKHMGYPTPYHRERLRQLGPCPAHRFSFSPVRQAAACPVSMHREDIHA